MPVVCDPVGEQLQLTDENLPAYLRSRGLTAPGAAVRVERAGDGNINWVRRARLGGARTPRGRPEPSVIVKQARPTLERFPQYRASTERIVFEHRYYEHARSHDLEGVCPTILAFDVEARVLVLEDLGEAPRLDGLPPGHEEIPEAASMLAALLGRVHAATREPGLAEHFANDDMRRLHGEHIFVLPFRENDFPLPAAVAERARALWADQALRAAADAAWERYLVPRGALLHGDVQAGNVLLADAGPVLLDAEIAHVGDPAFDLGTLLAHLLLPAAARGRPLLALPAVEAAWSAYGKAHGPDGRIAFSEAARYAAFEMVRRTVGAARVGSVEEVPASLAVLHHALPCILAPPDTPRKLVDR